MHRFRFLNRLHIQRFLQHKKPTTINYWLKDLTDKNFTGRIFKRSWTENSVPAVYYLSNAGIRYLKHEDVIHSSDLQKYYKDKNRSEQFRNRCLFIADLYLKFHATNTDNQAFHTQADFTPSSMMRELKPDFVLTRTRNGTTHYTLHQLIPEGMPRYAVRKRIEHFTDFLTTGEGAELPAKLVLICENESLMKYSERYVKRLVGDESADVDVSVYTYTQAQEELFT